MSWPWDKEPQAPRPHRPYLPVKEPSFHRHKRYYQVGFLVLAAIVLFSLGRCTVSNSLSEKIETLDKKVEIAEGKVAQRDDRIVSLETSLTATVTMVEELTTELTDERERTETYKKAAEEATKTVVPQKSTTVITPKPPTPTSYNTSGVEQWRSETEKWVIHYGGSTVNIDQFLSVMWKESKGDPTALGPVLSGGLRCAGLMQIHPCHTAKFQEITGLPYSTGVFVPEANIKFAAYMSAGGTNWSSWSAQP